MSCEFANQMHTLYICTAKCIKYLLKKKSHFKQRLKTESLYQFFSVSKYLPFSQTSWVSNICIITKTHMRTRSHCLCKVVHVISVDVSDILLTLALVSELF